VIELSMEGRPAPPPTFDEYVAARGEDLLRTAWLLTGDHRHAADLVGEALGRTWPRWSRIAESADSSYDTYVRHVMVTSYTSRWRGRRGSEDDFPAPIEPSPTDMAPDVRRDLITALARLPKGQRAVLILRYFDDLSEIQVAEALGWSATKVESQSVRALAALRQSPFAARDDEPEWEIETRLRAVLQQVVPEDLPTEGLTERARSYAGHTRRVHIISAAVVTAVVVAIVGVASSGSFVDRVGPEPTPRRHLSCTNPDDRFSVPEHSSTALSETVSAALVCAERGPSSVWPGALPPDQPVTWPPALDYLVLDPQAGQAGCPALLPEGPAFWITLLRKDGSLTTYANQSLACNGWTALGRYYIAAAEQLAQEQAAGPDGDPFLPCPSALLPTRKAAPGAPPALVAGTVLTKATVCLHPAPDAATKVPRLRIVRRFIVAGPALAQVNADLAAQGSRKGTAAPCRSWGPDLVYVMRATTSNGQQVELSANGACLPEFMLNRTHGDYWIASTATVDMIRSALGTYRLEEGPGPSG
jgi:RNA polymerase sigma-70 factor (sigma-E family)